MRAHTPITANGAPAQQANAPNTWLLCTPDGTPLYQPTQLVIGNVYIDGTPADVTEYVNNINSVNDSIPPGSITFNSGYAPAPTSTVTWDGTADDFELTLSPTLLSQYADSPVMLALLEYMNQWIDPALDIDLIYDNIWNVYTASGIGLDIWGRIVGADRTIPIVSSDQYFGFNTSDDSFLPFNQAPFYNGPVGAGLFTLTDDAYRVYILTKAFANISNMSIPNMNALLNIMFAGRGSCYVAELSALSIQYVFHFTLQAWEKSIMLQAQLLPRPAGVTVSVSTP